MKKPSTFKQIMGHVQADMDFARVYLDEVVICLPNLEEHLENVSSDISGIEKYGLKIKQPKCYLAQGKIGLLGYVVDENLVCVDPSMVLAI